MWGSDTTNTYSYLCGVEDPYETYDSSYTVSYTASELEQRLPKLRLRHQHLPGLSGAGVF